MSERRFTIYTLRRTSSRTVYAIYDVQEQRQYWDEEHNKPWTTTDRSEATQRCYGLNQANRA